MRLLLSAALICGAAAAQATTLYDADFSQVVLIDHTTTGNGLEPSPQAGANFTFGYSSAPSSDTSTNFFGSDGDSLISSDFGGDHFMRSDVIDVSAWDVVDVSVTADFLGTDSFNNSPTEFIQYVFILDGGLETEFFYFTDDPNASDLNAMRTLGVNGFSNLVVGLNANVNGAGDGFDVTAYTVEGVTPSAAVVPLPAGLPLALAGIGALGLVRARRRS